MKMITTIFLATSYIGYIESAFTEREKAIRDSSLLGVFDKFYHEAVRNQTRCRDLRSRARRFSLTARTAMPEMELDEHFIGFCSTLPRYNFMKPTAEWIFSGIFVQYSVIKSIFSLTVCRIYNLYALENPNVQRAKDCAMVASYLNVFRSIVFENRISEIEQIYKLADNPSPINAKARLGGKPPNALDMLSMKTKLVNLNNLLDRLANVIEAEGSQRVPSVSCEGTPVDRQKPSIPLEMHLDFCINGNAMSRALESIESKYMKGKSNNERDENYRKYYYTEAWSDIFYHFYIDFFPMVNYFNKVLYGQEPIPIRSGAFELFIPPIKESLNVWAIAHDLREVVETEYQNQEFPDGILPYKVRPMVLPNRSKVITILEMILMTKTKTYVPPRSIELTRISDRDGSQPDFFVDVKY